MDFIASYLAESAAVLEAFRVEPGFAETMRRMADDIATCIRGGGRLFLCGNGGSAADSQHLAAEYVSRLVHDRDPLPAIALTVDTSALTAIGNDYGYEFVFSRQIRALGHKGDVLLGISTSGNSLNVVRALEAARELGIVTHGFTGGREGTKMEALCDRLLAVPSTTTAMIQQIHITAGHIVCALTEAAIFPRN
jgi:D-sedoheptulose 7-phosphate isomerase